MRTRLTIPILVVSFLLLFGGLVSAAGPYPLPTPDFSHPSTPHGSGGWRVSRENLLVIYGTFTDTQSQNQTEAQIEAMFFPEDTFGTLVNYFKVVSGGAFELVPAAERGGEVDNGVVVINLGESGPFKALSPGERRWTLLERADSVVDFTQFDDLVDGVITGSELAIVTMYTDSTYTCGQTRSVSAEDTLDGKTVAFSTVEGGHTMNVLTYAHELGHQHMGMRDHYGFGAGLYDLAGPTCGGPTQFQFPSAWLRLHWGWGSVTTVTRDGYVAVGEVAPGDGSPILGQGYLLYDPERGVDDYFLIENRQREPGYDQSVIDSGLIIWRVDERQFSSAFEHQRLVEIIRPDGRRNPGCLDPDLDGRVDEEMDNDIDDDGDGLIDEDMPGPPNCYSGDSQDAWDPSDPFTPERTMEGRWADGTLAKLAVRAIAESDHLMWVYVDVRGPGVLVDPANAQGRRFNLDAPRGGSFNVSFPVMNTGETTDTFRFTVVVPSGWAASTQTMELDAGEGATATIKVDVPSSATTGPQILQARGQSTTDAEILTVAHFDAVVKQAAKLEYTGVLTAEYSDPANVSARVSDKFSDAPIAGREVTFTIGTQTATAMTNALGIASTSIVLNQAPEETVVSAMVGSDATFVGASASKPFTIDREDMVFTITSPLIQPSTSSATISVQAIEEADGSPGDLTLATVSMQLAPTLTTTSVSGAATLSASGTAVISFGVFVVPDLWTLSITSLGDYWEAPALIVDFVYFDPAASLLGFGNGADLTGERVKLTTEASYGGLTPRGTVEMHSKPNKFKTTEVRWIVVAGQRALIEAVGMFNDAPAVLRADITDSGLSGGRQDRFSLRIADDVGLLYQSGPIVIESGNLIVDGS
jgi:M6 family metalloprotease-like protein